MFTFIKNGEWKVKNRDYYKRYNARCHPVKTRYFEQKETSRLIGEATIGGTIKIIEKYKPSIWIIENPKTSKTWDFQKEHWCFKGIENNTNYSSYDKNFSKKPTIFKSNYEFNLKKDKSNGNKAHMANGNYAKRSSIPLLLIKDLIDQIIFSKEIKWKKK